MRRLEGRLFRASGRVEANIESRLSVSEMLEVYEAAHQK
jgi:hypothetical protein